MLKRLATHGSTVADSTLALALFGIALWEVLAEPLVDDVVGGPLALNLAAIALATLPLAARRVAPLAVAGAVYATVAARALVADPLELVPTFLATLVAAYSVAVYASRWASLFGLGMAVAALEIAALTGSGGDASPDAVAAPVFLTAVWAVGRVAGSRHARARTLERHAAERERRREEHARAAVTAERRRIALELHDAVSHSLALIVMQAAGAQGIIRRQPERAEQSLRFIERAGREGLTEMRRLLGLIGEDREETELTPHPGIASVQTLIEGARQAGLDVCFESAGEPRPVAPAVDLSAYRIVQEALTNAAKHAAGCRVTVALRWHPAMLEIEITNDGARPSQAEDLSPGRGLIGMRERAALIGGDIETGLRDDGEFGVWASLPLEAAS